MLNRIYMFKNKFGTKFSGAKSTFSSLSNLSLFFFSFVGLAFYRNKKYSLKPFTMSFLSLTFNPKRPVDCIHWERGVEHVQAWKDPSVVMFQFYRRQEGVARASPPALANQSAAGFSWKPLGLQL